MATTREDGRSRVDQLPRQVAAALWATPTVAQPGGSPDAFLARKAALNGACGVSLTDLRMQVEAAVWATPTASQKVRSEEFAAGRNPSAAEAAKFAMACWPTPTASLADKGVRSTEGAIREAARSHGPDLAAVTAAVPGLAPPGSSATTEKPGALAPGFVAWLMGFPPEWLDCAPETMPRKAKSK
ncbi:TPA_asm: methyltransferase [Cyanophage Cy-LDV1]|nr:TPA_asm: methyltransferase [Cyanophage Cy-LDV1]